MPGPQTDISTVLEPVTYPIIAPRILLPWLPLNAGSECPIRGYIPLDDVSAAIGSLDSEPHS